MSAIFATVSRYKVPVGKGSWPDGTPPKQQPPSGSSPLPAADAPSPVPSGQDYEDVQKHYGPGPHWGTGSPQTVHGGNHRGVAPAQVDVKKLEWAYSQWDKLEYPLKDDADSWEQHNLKVDLYHKRRDSLNRLRTVGPETWRRGTVYQLADLDTRGLAELVKGWRGEYVGRRWKLSKRQARVMKRLEATIPGITEWLNDRGVSIVFTPQLAEGSYAVGEFTISPHAGPVVWVETLNRNIGIHSTSSYKYGVWDDDAMFDTLLHEVGHAVDWDGTASVTHISKDAKFFAKHTRDKFKLGSGDVSWDYDRDTIKGLRSWYEGASDQIKAKYVYGYGPPPFATEWFAEGFEHYAKDGTTGNSEYDTFIESRLDDFDDLPLKVTVKKAATPSGLTDEEVAELFTLASAEKIPLWVAEGRNPRSMLEWLREQKVAKHYGPGAHPGTGSPQEVHSAKGRQKIKSSIETVRYIARNRNKGFSVDEFVDFNVGLAPDDEIWTYAWETYRKEHHALVAKDRAKVEAYLNGQLVDPEHPLLLETWGRSKREKIASLSSDLSAADSELMADNPWDEHGWGDDYGPNYHDGTFKYPPGFDAESWGAYVKDWHERKMVEIEEIADTATKEIVANSDVYIQIHRATLPEILEDGGFTTIHAQDAVGAIGEDFGTSHRRAYESDTFGITEDSLPPNMKPIYGYLWDKSDKDGAVIPENGLNLGNPRTALMKYGTVAVRLKPEVRDRTTFTFGDSFSLNMAVLPQPLNDPGWQVHGFLGGIVGTGMIETGARKPTDGMGWDKGWSYIEAQVHGGVTLDDIAEIIVDTPDAVERHQEMPFRRDWVTEWSELETMLDESGVPWRITERALP